MKLEIFFCQFPHPWALRVSGMGGYTSKCEKSKNHCTLLDSFRDSYPINVSHLNFNILCLLLLYESISVVQSHNCLLLKENKWKERQTFCSYYLFLTKMLFASKGLDDRPLFSKKEQRQKSLCYYSCIFLGHPSFPLYTEMGVIKVQFRWGFWAYSWDFSDLRFLPSLQWYSWINLSFLHWLIFWIDLWNHGGRMVFLLLMHFYFQLLV